MLLSAAPIPHHASIVALLPSHTQTDNEYVLELQPCSDNPRQKWLFGDFSDFGEKEQLTA
jgi:hypothetical protein